VCELVAVGADGTEETVTTWRVSARHPAPVLTRGGASLRPGEIDRFEVRAEDGQRLVTLRRR
ncbi:hypothetical protein P8605_47700, partial [Streptomyces sp. T-3]|nr:hypothetical protein [Streptomyces sp. T-3]